MSSPLLERALDDRRRSFIGLGDGKAACDRGGVGRDESLSLESLGGVGAVRIDCKARHELKMFPMALCALLGGLDGGEANSDVCSRVTGGCDESHERGEGINIVDVLCKLLRYRCACCMNVLRSIRK